MSQQQQRSRLIMVVLGVVAFAAAVLVIRGLINNPPGLPVDSSVARDDEMAIRKNSKQSARLTKNAASSSDRLVAQSSEDTAVSVPADADAATTEPYRERNATIGRLFDDFRGFQKSLDGYKLEHLERTVDGLELADDDSASSPSEGGSRRGTLESPVIVLAQPSNAVQPIWRVKSVPDSGCMVEVALSADQEKWSQWYAIEPSGDDISPTYPDGRPNPNYGAISGSGIANGLELYPYARYRLTLTSTSKASPVLQEFRLTYVDTTEGLGKIADPNSPPLSDKPPTEATPVL
ncbi:MAG: hypothetical protein ACR2IE_01750 [Candidatus Sumerlaeaceae bacterium]